MGEDFCAEGDNCRHQPVLIAFTENNSGKACYPSIEGEIEHR